ncbi:MULTISPECIES: D-alanyl-D-alanine carboxypeptidase family protein [unclassified Neptuniibacter]|jgi:D-alanyl-D-alanine carboxypeptidase (penicillin-binding protein 5/6)|uniref:D-alanyl-D-alanine carboxypeptidase family protein n=1 Tax=unclassified Neptuniibacter TaxID=2630693 RepID=UPI0026E35B7E|nr:MULTISPECIES: D-alanyl-D-alanine carboxypeptidase family protein [unclassified Neptuniibacter]MDO6514799.1 D-alanyl-D-alanine carboxypeptidase family protein [Neptuniibacter sp. 2_MG-2023]MDO6593331.1 D-alanyl-D-alanine carboxypeptidase family protein [Neptuniibacter sp. 1_MG-2023]
MFNKVWFKKVFLNKVSKVFSLLFLTIAVVNFSSAASLIPAEPQIAATAYLVIDADTGKIIAAKNENERFAPASLTKMMTAYILEYELSKGNVSTDDLVLISEKAWRTQGSRMFIREGTQVRLGDLMKGIVIQSGNDASVAVAEHIAGSEAAFADLMNQHAKLLGMKNTNFMNATGLPAEGHESSAFDLALLAKAIIQDFPEHYGIYSEKYFTYNKIRQPNRNKLLWRDKTVDGLKTGHTDAAGYCLVASAKRDGMRLISVVLGTSDEEARARESQKLLSYAFRYYRTHQLYKSNVVLNTAKVWSGTQDQLRIGISDPLSVTIPRGQADKLQAIMDVDRVITAPIMKGQELGKVRVTLDGDLVTEVPLVAMDAIPEAGLLKRIWHAILLFFTSLIG